MNSLKKLGPVAGFVAVIFLVGATVSALNAWDQHDPDTQRIQIGYDIAPVPLNIVHKDGALVGLGSYLVNAQGGCNDCHRRHGARRVCLRQQPYAGQPKKVNAVVYLSGGHDCGPVGPGSPDIISRNLTPDKTGLPEGGRSFSQFLQIMRHGTDFDHVHPPCTGAPGGTCLPPMYGDGIFSKSCPGRPTRA